jgi:hypothetical protein
MTAGDCLISLTFYEKFGRCHFVNGRQGDFVKIKFRFPKTRQLVVTDFALYGYSELNNRRFNPQERFNSSFLAPETSRKNLSDH